MSMFSVGGLASGLDTKAIINQLMQLEARPKVRKEWSHTLWQERRSIWNDLNGRLLQLQSKSNVLNSPGTWSGTPGITSSDPTKLTGAAGGPSPAVGTYTINIAQLATTETWSAAASLPAATGGVRQSGSWWAGAFTEASGATALTSLTDVDGTSLGLDVGSTITLNAMVNGAAVSGSYVVTAASTVDDMVQWAESSFPGATFTTNPDGTVTFKSAAGSTNEIDSLSFTATNSYGTSLTVFNGTSGASTSFVSAPTGGAAANDTLTITQGASSWSIAVGQGDDEATIAQLINSTAGIGVTASVVGGKLQLAAASSGAAGSFSVASAGTLATDLGLAETVAGQDARFDIDGTAYTRSTNTGISDVITDVKLDLAGVTTTAVTLTVTAGTPTASELKTKIKEFVDQYNSVIDFINAKTGEQRVINPKSLNEFVRGPLARDFAMSSVANDLRRWATDTIGGLADGGNALDDIGITTGAWSAAYNPQNASGRLVIDDAKLDAALAADPAKVQAIFATAGGAAGHEDDGITRRITTLVSDWRNGGKVDMALQGASRQVSDLQKTIDRAQDRLDRRRTHYERMFASLETVLGRMQSQQAWMAGQLASLSSGS